MTSKLDLDLLSLYRLNGQDQPALPGLLAAVPPRRTARGRENDRLLICLSITGNVRTRPADYAEMTRQMADRYYSLSGAVTSALKSTAEALNAFLLERNIRMGGRGQAATGLLVMGALRDNQLFLVLSGPVHAFWIGPHGTRHYFDDQLAGRGLGMSQTARLYYAQATLQPGDRVLLATYLPSAWKPILESERGAASLDVMYRRLMTDAGPEAQAVLIVAREGTGQFNLLRPASHQAEAQPPAPIAAPAPAAASPAESTPQPPQRPPMQRPPVSQSQPTAAAPQRPPMQRPPVSQSQSAMPQHAPLAAPPTPAENNVEPAAPPARGLPLKRPAPRLPEEHAPEPKELVRRPGPDSLQPFFKKLAESIRAMRQAQQRWSQSLGRLMPRLLPVNQDESAEPVRPAGSSAWGVFMALALPVILITVGVVVYSQYGRTAQYQTYFTSAQEAATKASSITEPIAQRRAWEETLYWLDKAEAYQGTPESRNLRRQAQASLDALDNIKRVTFQLALAQAFPEAIKISRMVASENDVFLFNAERGEVTRVTLTQRGYEVDPNFICRPGTYSGGVVGPLVDVVSLPRANQFNALAAGIDASGTLLYCLPNGQSPQVVPLNPPESGWKRIAAIGLDGGSLYVLDADANAVWTYYGNQSNFLNVDPLFFFDEQIPLMGNVIDMAVNGDDIYLLNSDGHLITCTLSRVSASPTRCVDPAPLVDRRPGRQGGVTLPDAIFSQVVFSPPPNISVAMLDANNRAVYRFSPRGLELQDQLRPVIGEAATLPGGPIAAMAFSPNQVLFVFVNNRLYYAADVR
ncbi:MAG: hypothetical protein WHV44_06415 [Anaerolineales bacterium]